MSPRRPLNEAERVALALADAAYQAGTVRLTRTDLSGYSHLVASRQGLFAVNERGYTLVAYGFFFGITLLESDIYLFEACDLPGFATRRGRIIRLARDGDRIIQSEVIASGLDNGCHQIDILDGLLCVLDTYNQKVLRFSLDGMTVDECYPLARAENRDWLRGYAHINSLLKVSDRILLLLHNGAEHTGEKSAIAVFDREWRQVDRWPLPGGGCHNIAVLDDGTLLSCGSVAGELISLDGLCIKISSMMTRGLSAGADTIAVGSSKFSSRRDRHLVPGTVTFLDRSYGVRSVLDLPGAPTEIRKLDGHDYSLSAFVHGMPR